MASGWLSSLRYPLVLPLSSPPLLETPQSLYSLCTVPHRCCAQGRREVVDEYWLHILLALIGEAFEDTDEVTSCSAPSAAADRASPATHLTYAVTYALRRSVVLWLACGKAKVRLQFGRGMPTTRMLYGALAITSAPQLLTLLPCTVV